jgi:sulfoxide reductase heme-binding subunit YedZ
MYLQFVIRWLEHHPKLVRTGLLGIVIGLTGRLLWPIFSAAQEPFLYQSVMHQSGKTSLIYLVITLSLTPLRRWLTLFAKRLKLSFGKRLSDWNVLIRHRRNVGLSAAYFSLLHLVFYLWLDMGWLFAEILWDINSRIFVLLGWCCGLIMLILASTSPKVMQRKLKKRWRTVQRSIYVLAPLAVTHFALSLKPEHYDYVVYAISIGVLLLHRVFFKFKKSVMSRYDNGMEAHR